MCQCILTNSIVGLLMLRSSQNIPHAWSRQPCCTSSCAFQCRSLLVPSYVSLHISCVLSCECHVHCVWCFHVLVYMYFHYYLKRDLYIYISMIWFVPALVHLHDITCSHHCTQAQHMPCIFLMAGLLHTLYLAKTCLIQGLYISMTCPVHGLNNSMSCLKHALYAFMDWLVQGLNISMSWLAVVLHFHQMANKS